jgi:hypothetical protein
MNSILRLLTQKTILAVLLFAMIALSALLGMRSNSAQGGGWKTKAPMSVLLSNPPAAAERSELTKPDEATRARVTEAYGKLPLSFEANRGQTDNRVKFLSRGSGYNLFLTSTEAVIQLRNSDSRSQKEKSGVEPTIQTGGNLKREIQDPKPTVMRMNVVGANKSAQVEGRDELPGKSNYFIGSDPNKWRTNVSNYSKVEYRDVYPGVDLIYYGNQRQLEHDFVVAPGADSKAITLAFQGARKMSLNSGGDLVIGTKEGEVQLKQPRVYQKVNGEEQTVAARYVLKGKGRVGFEVAEYDRRQPLVIDPVLTYATYLGGSNYDIGTAIAVDALGNAYVTGRTQSTNFPTTGGAFQTTSGGGGMDTFVTKLNPTGSALVYSTYLGGSSVEEGRGIAVDALGNAYVTGTTGSTNFPTTPGAFQTALGGAFDVFVTKLNPTGSALVYSTYLGGGNDDYGYGIAVDSLGNGYVTGQTLSTNFPTTPGAFQTTYGGGDSDAYATKLNTTGSALVYSTYLGGSSFDSGNGIAVDALGNAYVTGVTSTNFPTTAGAFQPTLGGGQDAFVTKLNPTGSALVYSTYVGGGDYDSGNGIALDSAGNAYVAGHTQSTNFPTTNGAFKTTLGGSMDAFVTKLNPTGSALVYSTYVGGSNVEGGYHIAVDSSGNAWVTGQTYSSDFPTTSGAMQTTLGGGGDDAYVTKLNPTGSALVYSSYLGGNGADVGYDIAVDSSDNAYVTVETFSTNFPTTPGAFQTTFGGGGDAFVAKISQPCTPPPPGMVSWWPGDGNANDIVGGNNATLMNGATFAPGQVGHAFFLDGIDDFVDLGNAPSLQVSSGEFTVDAWVRFNSLGGDMSIVDKMAANGVNADGWRLIKQNDNRFWFCFGGGANRCFDPAFTVFSTTRAVTGVWFHVAVVKSSGSFALYVNGVREDIRSPVPAFLDTNSANLRIGSYAGQGGYGASNLNGLVDEVEIFNRALTAEEIQAIFAADSAGKCKNRAPTAICHNVTVSADPECTANASIDNGSFDPDSGDTITVSQSPSGPYPLGNTTVTLTVTDNHGASSSCTATVTVADNTLPTISCPANITVTANLGSNSAAVSYPAPTASDNCGVPLVSCTIPSGSSFAIGTTTVSCTATDGSSNTASCAFTVTVLTPQGATQQVGNTVNALVSQGTLSQANGNALTTKLQAAINSINSGNTTAGCNQLQAFINQTQAFINAGKLTRAQGQVLIDAANALKGVLGC